MREREYILRFSMIRTDSSIGCKRSLAGTQSATSMESDGMSPISLSRKRMKVKVIFIVSIHSRGTCLC